MIGIVLNIIKSSLGYSRLTTAVKVIHIDFINFIYHTSKVKSCRICLPDHKQFTLRDKHIRSYITYEYLYKPGMQWIQAGMHLITLLKYTYMYF